MTDSIQPEDNSELAPRRYRRYRDMRTYAEACDWSRTLDLRNNPYDRFLLVRELLHHLETSQAEAGRLNIFRRATREEVVQEINVTLDRYLLRPSGESVFRYVMIMLPMVFHYKYGAIKYSRLTQASSRLPDDSSQDPV